MITSRFVVLSIILLSTSALAKTWTDLNHPVRGPEGSSALTYVKAHATQFGVPAGADLAVTREIPLKGGRVVRIGRSVDRLPVLNANLSVLILGGKIVAASGRLDGAAGSGAAVLGRQEATKAVERLVPGAKVRDARSGYWRLAGELRSAWALDVFRPRPLGGWRVVIDATTGQVLSAAATLHPVVGKAYTPNPSVGTVQQVQLDGLATSAELSGEHADVRSCGYSGGTLVCSRYAVPDAATGNYLDVPDEPSFIDGFSEVHAYYHVDLFHRWLASSFGFARKGATQQIKVAVNFNYENSNGNTQGLYNAFFGDIDGDGKGDLTFGQGKRDFAYDADVIYHEFTHSVVDETSDLSADLDELGFNMMPMSLNEAFADLFSSAFAGDPVVGEYAGNGGIRTLKGNASCPTYLTGESHQEGLMWGQAAWSVREQAQDKALFDHVLYKTLVALDSHATFADTAAMFLAVAANEAPALVPAAKAEFTARGLDDCSRIVPLAEGDERKGYLMGTDSMPLAVVPGPVQYKVEVPAEATELHINLSRNWGYPGSTSTLGAYIRKGSPVSFAGTKAVYDVVLPNTQSTITLTRNDSKNRLDPGNTYYIIPLNIGANDSSYKLTMALTLEEPPLIPPDASGPSPDAGVPALDGASASPATPDEVGDSGCACSVAATPKLPPLPLLALLGLALVLLRRR